MSDFDSISCSSSDESIVRSQASKLFKYADADHKGYIVKEDLGSIKDYVGLKHFNELEDMMNKSNECYISEKEFIQMINELAESPSKNEEIERAQESDKPIVTESNLQFDPYNLAAELSSATVDSKYEDPLVDMLRDTMELSMAISPDPEEELQKENPSTYSPMPIPTVMITPCENALSRSQLESPDYPFIVENVATRQNNSTIMEKPGYTVSIKKPQYRPIEPGDMHVGSSILGAPSLADELNQAEEVHNNIQNEVKFDKNSCNPDRIFKVVFVGDSAVGKTCFLHRY